jgi:hypothetical protein
MDQGIPLPITYSLTLKNGNKTLQSSKNNPLQISFGQQGKQLLIANITKGECKYQIEKTLTTYEKSLVYLGENEEAFHLNYDQNFADDNIYFTKLLLDHTATEEDIETLLRKELRHLAHADILIIKYGNFDQVLHAYVELLEQELIHGEGKSIFIVSNTNQSFINRVLSLFIQALGPQQIATVKTSDFLNFLTALSLGKGEEEINEFASFHGLQAES